MRELQKITAKPVLTFPSMKHVKRVSPTAKNAKSTMTWLITHLRKKGQQIYFCGDGLHCFANKTSYDYKTEKPSLFLRRVFAPLPNCSSQS